ncbi:MAG: hypothetical protein IMX00_10240 [Limnochordales bacterium]|nr:hypothetical protein [Limnochordales bacterium]
MEGRARRRGGKPKGGPWLRVGLFLLVSTLVSPLMAAADGAPVVAAAAETVSSSSWESEAKQALETLSAAGIISPPVAELAPPSREEVALWLYRLLTHFQQEDFLITDSTGKLVLSPAARAALQQWVAAEVAAQLAAAGESVPARERVIERQVVVEAGPREVLPVLTRAEEALRQAQQALESALAAQQAAVSAKEAAEAAAARLKVVEEELLAARQALGVLEAQMRELSQLGSTVAELAEQVASLNRGLAELQESLGAADQRVTAVDLRVAATQGDIETLRLLIDRRVEELAKKWGIDKEKLEAELAEARNRVAAVEKDAVRQEALAAVTALVEARTGHLEAAINQLAGELRPELVRLDGRLAAVEKQLGLLDERVSALEAGLKDQGIRLQQMEERSPSLAPKVWAAWVSTGSEGNIRYGLEISWDRAGREGVLADLAGSWRSEWEPETGSLWQKLGISKPLGPDLTGDLVLELLPLAPEEGESTGETGSIQSLAARWAVGIRKEAPSWPGLAFGLGGSLLARGQWWRVQVTVPMTEAGAPLQVEASGWLAGGLTGETSGEFPYLHVPGSTEEAFDPEVGLRLLATNAHRHGSVIAGGWEWRQKPGSAATRTARQGWLSLELPVGSDTSLSLIGRRWWFSGPGDGPKKFSELRISLNLDL